MFWSRLLTLFDGGQGRQLSTVNSVEVVSWLPVWLFPFIVAALAYACWKLYGKQVPPQKRWLRISLTALRTLAYAAAVIVLAMPLLKFEAEGMLPGTIPVVVDATQSMTIADAAGAGNTTAERFKRALKLTEELRAELKSQKPDIDLAFYQYANGLKELPPEATATAKATGDYSSINQMLAKGIERHLGDYCPGILLLTDGAHNTAEVPERSLEFFTKRSIPIYTCGFGKEKIQDLGVTNILSEDVIFVEEKAQAFVTVTASGYIGRTIQVTMNLDGKQVCKVDKPIDRDGDISVPVEFIPAKKGLYALKAEIPVQDGEVTAANNSLTKNIRVIDEKIRILLAAGSPSWEYRYLIGAFERDKRVDMKLYLASVDKRILDQVTDPAKARYVAKLPTKMEDLNRQYDMVIMTRLNMTRDVPEGFAAALEGFVKEKGGGLVFMSDPEFLPFNLRGTKLEPVLPVVLGPSKPRSYNEELLSPLKDPYIWELTEDGYSSPLVTFAGDREENRKVWSEFPAVYSSYRPAKLKPSAMALASLVRRGESEKIPALAHHIYGRGPVLYMGVDSTWRWRKEHGDRYFRDFWGKAVQFIGLPHLLNESARSAISVANENVEAGETVAISARIANLDLSPFVSDKVELKVLEGDVPKAVTLSPVMEHPGQYRGEYLPQLAGTLRLELPEATGAKPLELRVTAQQREFQSPAQNKLLLGQLSTGSHGYYFDKADAKNILHTMIEMRPKVPLNLEFSLWDTMAMLLLVLILFSIEWLIRKLNYLD